MSAPRTRARSALMGATALVLGACAGAPSLPPSVSPPSVSPALVSGPDAYATGKAHLAAGRLGLAVDAFTTARRLDPASVAALNGLGVAYDRLGRHRLAERAYLDALDLAPRDAMTLNNLGWSRHLRNEGPVAAFYLAQAARLAPDDPVMRANLTLVETSLGRPAFPPAPPAPPTADIREAAAVRPAPRLVRRNAGEQMLVFSAPPAAGDTPSPAPARAPDSLERVTRIAAHPPAPAAPDGAAAVAVMEEVAVAWEAAPSPPPPRSADPVVGVEVANGTGRRLMATRIATWLGRRDVAVARRTNADHYGYETSMILHTPDSRAQAEALAARLPHRVEVRPAGPGQRSPLRLVLGADLLAFDATLAAGGTPAAAPPVPPVPRRSDDADAPAMS